MRYLKFLVVGFLLFSIISCGENNPVVHINQTPILDPIGDKDVYKGDTLNFSISASDPDGDSLILTVENLPINATFVDSGNNKGLFNFIPDTTQIGVNNVTFIATDDDGLSDYEVVKITVYDDILPAFGEENTLEIVTWNIQEFPKEGQTTISKVENIIRDSDVDIFAIQEIADTNAFRQVLMDLPGYNGLYSEDTYSDGSYQKTGIIYKKDMIEIISHSQLFWNDWAFPRPPLLLKINAEKDCKTFNFYLIIIHLKAKGGWDNIDKRRAAACSLKNYIDEKVAIEEEKDYIVAGDWNDEIDDTEQENSFNVFIADSTNYKFLTWPLAGKQYYASWPHYPYYSLIDHILISKDCFDEFDNGSIETLRLDDDIINYFQIISDHRPVMAKFPVF